MFKRFVPVSLFVLLSIFPLAYFAGCSSSDGPAELSDALVKPGVSSFFVQRLWHGDSVSSPSWTEPTFFVQAHGSFGGKSDVIMYNDKPLDHSADSISHYLAYEDNGDISMADADLQWTRFPVHGDSLQFTKNSTYGDSLRVRSSGMRWYATKEKITLVFGGQSYPYMAKKIHERATVINTLLKLSKSDTAIVTTDYWFVPQLGWLARDSTHNSKAWTSHELTGVSMK